MTASLVPTLAFTPWLPRPSLLVAVDAKHALLADGATPSEQLRAGPLRALAAFACYYSARRAWPPAQSLALQPVARPPPADADFCDAFWRTLQGFATAGEVARLVLLVLGEAEAAAAGARSAAAAAATGVAPASPAAAAAAATAAIATGALSGLALGVSEALGQWLDPGADYFLLLRPDQRIDALAAGAAVAERLRPPPPQQQRQGSLPLQQSSMQAASPLEAVAAALQWPVLAASAARLAVRVQGAALLADALQAVVARPGAGAGAAAAASALQRVPASLLAMRGMQAALGLRAPPPAPFFPLPSPMPPPAAVPASGLWGLPPQELAEQWTLLDHAAFTGIPPQELVDCGWDKPRYEHSADGVRRYIDRFNAVALWVSAEVLAQPGDEERAALITRAAQVAAQLRRLNNFCGVSAVAMALRRESVARLSYSWQLVPRPAQAKLAELSAMIQDKEQYRRYKEALRAATTGAAAGETPAVPHLGAHTMELTAAEMNLPDTVELGRGGGGGAGAGAGAPVGINFKRHRTLLAMAAPVLALQTRCYVQTGVIVAPNAAVQAALQAALRPFFFQGDEEREAAVARLEARSFKVEPEAAAAEAAAAVAAEREKEQEREKAKAGAGSGRGTAAAWTPKGPQA